MRPPRYDRGAFTLVEILVASAVLALLALGIFRVFRSSNRANVQALWYTRAENQARNTLALVRNDLAKASCRSTVSEADVQRDCSDSYVLHANQGEIELGGGEVELLRFAMCEPEVSTGDAAVDKAGGCTYAVLRAIGRTLNYYRESESGREPGMNKDVCEDVQAVAITVEANATSEGDQRQGGRSYNQDGQVVTIALTLTHPQPALFPNARVEQQTVARAPVPLGGGGT